MKRGYLTPAEAAEYLGLSRDQLKRLTSARGIPFHKLNARCIRFDADELDQWMREHRVAPEAS